MDLNLLVNSLEHMVVHQSSESIPLNEQLKSFTKYLGHLFSYFISINDLEELFCMICLEELFAKYRKLRYVLLYTRKDTFFKELVI